MNTTKIRARLAVAAVSVASLVVMFLAGSQPANAAVAVQSAAPVYSASVMVSARATGLAPALMAKMAAAGWRPAAPDAGGPSCQYDPYGIIKTCFQHGGHGTIVEVWGSLTSQFGHAQAISLFGWTKSNTARHAGGACAAGAIGGAIATAPGAETGVAVVAGITGGCIGGTLAYWWAS